MRLALGLALLLPALTPASAAADTPRQLFVYGDSLAVGAEPYMQAALPLWRVTQDVGVNRAAASAPPALRELGEHLAPVVHVSLGTIDDPARARRFRRNVRRTMRAAGPERCVAWANIFRPAPPGAPRWTRLNRVLAREARERDNLVVVDWHAMAKAHPEWLSSLDGTHVSERGYRRRAAAVAAGVRECRDRLEVASLIDELEEVLEHSLRSL